MPSPSKDPWQPSRSAVITVSYGSGEVLETFLRTLREFHGPDQTVVVVDNKPDVQNVRELTSRFNAVYLPMPNNPGYGAGMNAGVLALDRQFDSYFFCNPDVSFIGPTVSQLSQWLMSAPRAGSIGPRILNDDGTVYPSARNIPSVATGIGHAFFGKIWPRNPWTQSYQNVSNYAERRPTGSLSGAAVMVKRQVFDRIDGWDESYFMHFEDIDLGYRIGLSGYENIYEPSVAVHHSGAHSTKKHAVVVERAMTDSAIRFMKKRYSGVWSTPLRVTLICGLKARGWLKLRQVAHENAG